MLTHFCLTVRFLQPYSHGRGNRGDPEWPPSPLRAFQALVSAAAARWNERLQLEFAIPALRWLEQQEKPMIVAVTGFRSDAKYRLYVPDNVGDKVAKSWVGGREGSIADYRTEKDVRRTRLKGEAVHYLFPLTEDCPHLHVLAAAARSITHLGWGVDMVAGNASVISEEDAVKLPGERWRPTERGGTALRVPIEGTLAALADKHAAFLTRLGPDGFNPVPPLTAFATVGYRRDTDVSPRPFAAFALLTPDADNFRSFDTIRRTPTVAGMMRHATGQAAALHRPDDPNWVATFVCGHGSGHNQPATSDERFSYIPIPTIEERGNSNVVGSIRRVLVVEPPGGAGREIAWVRQRLSGQSLIDEQRDQPVGTLSLIPTSDRRLRWYVPEKGARVWSTVTPVILPGYDDHNQKKTEQLLRKALEQAGFPDRLRDEAVFEWRGSGFRPGVDLASRYFVGAHQQRLPRYHVRICWPVPVPGPLCLGAGRYYGMGLFAADDLP